MALYKVSMNETPEIAIKIRVRNYTSLRDLETSIESLVRNTVVSDSSQNIHSKNDLPVTEKCARSGRVAIHL